MFFEVFSVMPEVVEKCKQKKPFLNNPPVIYPSCSYIPLFMKHINKAGGVCYGVKSKKTYKYLISPRWLLVLNLSDAQRSVSGNNV